MAELFKPERRKIDVLSSEAFMAEMLARMEGKSLFVLDLSEVQFIDSSGLGKIVSALREFRGRGGEMRICGVQAPVQVLFSMVRLGEIIGIDADAKTSAAALRDGAGTNPGEAP